MCCTSCRASSSLSKNRAVSSADGGPARGSASADNSSSMIVVSFLKTAPANGVCPRLLRRLPRTSQSARTSGQRCADSTRSAIGARSTRHASPRSDPPRHLSCQYCGGPRWCAVPGGLHIGHVTGRNPGVHHHTEIVGTLAYLAPEQTGRTGRTVDRRAALYALGTTLFELATGEPPFGSGDPLRLNHDHLARVPTPPHVLNSVVPEQLLAIIFALGGERAGSAPSDSRRVGLRPRAVAGRLAAPGRTKNPRGDNPGHCRRPRASRLMDLNNYRWPLWWNSRPPRSPPNGCCSWLACCVAMPG